MTLEELLYGIDQLGDETRDNGLSEIAADRLRGVRDWCNRVVADASPGEYAMGKEAAALYILDLLDEQG